MKALLKKFCEGWNCAPHERDVKKDKEIRDNLTEKQVDKSIQDSFPASDPASTY